MERHDMDEPSPRFWPIFFELYESLPRQGPGNRDCAARALAFCRDLPPTPAVLDLGWWVLRDGPVREEAIQGQLVVPGKPIVWTLEGFCLVAL